MANNVVMDPAFWADFNRRLMRAELRTMQNIQLDVSAREVVPFDHGFLQASHHVSLDADGARIETSVPYSEKQYFDASLKHNKGPHAGTAKARWLDDYLNGNIKYAWVVDKFQKNLRKELSR